ncbi:hypothetical protein JCM10908_003349 [Rhodotorula pacifica]|uniref:uncharacterized protein n=1 Tax=Rhodotorula pacifica TaxID=1495444 RepID=UPI00317F8BC1
MTRMTGSLETAVDADYSVVMSWDFEANLWDLPEQSDPIPLKSVPLRGDWYITITSSKDSEGGLDVNFALSYHGLEGVAALGEQVEATIRLGWLLDGCLHALDTDEWKIAPWPEGADDKRGTVSFDAAELAASACTHSPDGIENQVRLFRIGFTLSRQLRKSAMSETRTPFTDMKKAVQLRHLNLSPFLDLRLRFHHSSGAELELWTTAAFLSEASEYYKDLLSSGLLESRPRRSKRQRNRSSVVNGDEPSEGSDEAVLDEHWSDSDDETDDFVLDRKVLRSEFGQHGHLEHEMREVKVLQTAYSTYRAVLLYLHTGDICFLPLRSSLAPRNARISHTRLGEIEEYHEKSPGDPLPVSPKSVYRLAHLSRREDLQKVALAAFANDLTISGVAYELFSPVSIAYDELRKVAIDYVVKHWDAVQATESWNEMRTRATSSDIKGGAGVLFDLLAAIQKAP